MPSSTSPLLKTLRSPWTLGTLAAAAAGTAVFTHRRAQQAPQDNPPLGKFLEVDGTRVHYLERGEGPVVVLLHGNAVSLEDYLASDVFTMLSPKYRVVALDCPGFGHSERGRRDAWTAQKQARLIEGALTQLGVERFTLVAHSWSTLIALAIALDHPGRVQGLVLVSGYYYPSIRWDVPIAAAPAIPLLGDLMRYTVSAVSARLMLKPVLKAMFSPAPVPTEYTTQVPREMMLRPSQMRATAEDAAFMIPAARALSQRYAELEMPITILAGEDDKIVRPEGQSARLHAAVPQSRLEVLPGLGHMVHHGAPEKVVAAVNDMQASASNPSIPLPHLVAAAA